MDVSNQISYDGYNFGDNGWVVTLLDHLKLAPRNNQFEDIAGRDGSKLVESSLGIKPIRLNGYFKGTPAQAQAKYDELAAVVNRTERTLIVPHAGATRTYVATPSTTILEQPDGLDRLLFDIEFQVPSGYARSETKATLFNGTITFASQSFPLDVKGSVDARPIISINYSNIVGGTNKSIFIRNARDLTGISITRNWVSGDTVVIDSENFMVYVNDRIINPDGRLPVWPPGNGSLSYTDQFTNRTATITGQYNQGNL